MFDSRIRIFAFSFASVCLGKSRPSISTGFKEPEFFESLAFFGHSSMSVWRIFPDTWKSAACFFRVYSRVEWFLTRILPQATRTCMCFVVTMAFITDSALPVLFLVSAKRWYCLNLRNRNGQDLVPNWTTLLEMHIFAIRVRLSHR